MIDMEATFEKLEHELQEVIINFDQNIENFNFNFFKKMIIFCNV